MDDDTQADEQANDDAPERQDDAPDQPPEAAPDAPAANDNDDAREEAAHLRAELNAVKRRLADEQKGRKKAERAAAAHKRAEDEEAGEYRKLYEEKVAEYERLERSVAVEKMDRAVIAAARRLQFRNPDLAPRLVQLDDDVEPDDDPLIERALKKLAKQEPYLLRADRGQTADAGQGDRRPATQQASPSDDLTPMERLRVAYSGPPTKRETVKTW